MIAQTDHPYVLEWLANASRQGGGFLAAFATACLVADHTNYPLLMHLISKLSEKYPYYMPSEQVKKDLAPAVAAWEQGERK